MYTKIGSCRFSRFGVYSVVKTSLYFIYRVSQLFPAMLQGVIYDVNWNNFYPKHFSFLRRLKKFQNVANIDIFEKKIVFSFSRIKDVYKT